MEAIVASERDMRYACMLNRYITRVQFGARKSLKFANIQNAIELVQPKPICGRYFEKEKGKYMVCFGFASLYQLLTSPPPPERPMTVTLNFSNICPVSLV
jgi:hypothetical protein